MGSVVRWIIWHLIQLPIFKPAVRLVVGATAIPLFRVFLKRCVRLQEMDAELEKDLEQWFRGSLLLLVATKNMEDALFGWVPLDLNNWFPTALRILLAIGVTEAMPDKELFRIIHPGPPKLILPRGHIIRAFKKQFRPWVKGLICQHLDRSSQLFAIMAAIFSGPVGWTCYTFAIVQYLIIGLVTSRDRAVDVLKEFDLEMERRRQWLLEELQIAESTRQQNRDASTAAAAEVAVMEASSAAPLPSGLLATESTCPAAESDPQARPVIAIE